MAVGRPGKGADHKAWQQACAALESGAEPSFFVSLAASSKAARKAVAAAIAGEEGRDVREHLAKLQGLPSETAAERLLRLAAGAEAGARKRSNPIVINDPFDCAHCGFAVPAAPGAAVRNHCPRCLRSLHLDDKVPGDRLSDCHAIMDPEDPRLAEGVFRITHRFRRCGFTRRNRLTTDWSIEPDRTDSLWPGSEPKKS